MVSQHNESQDTYLSKTAGLFIWGGGAEGTLSEALHKICLQWLSILNLYSNSYI